MIFAVVIIVIASILVAIGTFQNVFHGSPHVAEEFDILGVKSHPFSLAEIISHKRPSDRNLFEQILETSTSGFVNANTKQMPLALYDIASKFSFIQFFEFKLTRNAGTIFVTSNIPSRCGQDDEGFCVYDPGYANVCDTGRIVILDREGKCQQGTVCCKYDPVSYVQKQGKNTIKQCGDNKGICSGIFLTYDENTSTIVSSCNAGLVPLGKEADKQCKDANDGNTPYCCAPLTSLFEEEGQERTARIPFLYRGPALFEPKEYNCQSVFSKCNGEYINGLCDYLGNPNVQCCITDTIRCAPPNSKYLCRDTNTGPEHCPASIIDTLDKPKTCPGPETYRCCKIEDPPELDQSTLDDPKVLGKCILDGQPYYDQVLGELEVKVFEGQR